FARAAETTNENDKAYAAQSGYELVKVFKAIEGSVTFQSVSAFTPNVSPGSASSFESSDELYYPLFEPQNSLRWPGNLKRYSFWDLDSSPDRSDFQVVDVNMQSVYNDALASDTFTIIKDSARSWWSNSVDGSDVASGGAAGETAAANRNVYTFIPGIASKQSQEIVNNPLSNDIADAYWFEQSPQALTGVEKQNLVDYADTLWGPVIHNLPMLVNQMRTFDVDAYLTGSINTVYVGDNAGFIRAVNAGEPTSSTVTTNLNNTGGNEFWAFMPVELIPNIYRLNAEATEAGSVNPNYHNRYVYGVDGEITVLGADYNRDGDFLDSTEVKRSYKDASGGIMTETVTLDDTMNIYFGLRRGGSAYYGLNVADTYAGGSQNPKLLFRLYNTYTTTVQGNALIGDVRNIQLDRLAETWSPMEKAKLRLNGEVKNVLIFGGGYDSDQNEAIDSDIINYDVINTPQLGNAVYIVDAETGELLSYVSGVVTDTAKGVSSADMNYSIPGRIAVVDLGGDGVDLLYATDTGGQVFRIEIDSGAGSYDTDGDGAVDTDVEIVSSVTTIAKLGRSVATTDEDNRYFFSGPVASFVKQGDMKDDLALVISSGFVPQLDNAEVQDYIITLFEKDVYIKEPPAIATPYTLDNFVTIDPDSAALEYENNTLLSTINTTDDLIGWKLPLNKSNAEKVTGEPKLIKERLFLTTFSIDNPDQLDQCSIAVGQSNSYAMYLDATAIYSSGRVINTSAGFSTTGSVLKNVRDSNDTYFLFGTKAVCLEGNCNQTLQLDTPPTPVPENFFTDTESLIRSKWRQCIDSDFIDCGSNIGVGGP
ncbi:MAG: hypothetical protein SVC26_02705, partial [Pseudomonadota bacterium]|nr:hypothetical protein [Pseudomonadota bacterium]